MLCNLTEFAGITCFLIPHIISTNLRPPSLAEHTSVFGEYFSFFLFFFFCIELIVLWKFALYHHQYRNWLCQQYCLIYVMGYWSPYFHEIAHFLRCGPLCFLKMWNTISAVFFVWVGVIRFRIIFQNFVIYHYMYWDTSLQQ